jgi:2-hydroxychromene-2-carboxylate isomerase
MAPSRYAGCDVPGRGKSSWPRAAIEFWCELASTYTYLAASRIEALVRARGVTVKWSPFLLGPIFAAAGWPTFTVGDEMLWGNDRLEQALDLAAREGSGESPR